MSKYITVTVRPERAEHALFVKRAAAFRRTIGGQLLHDAMQQVAQEEARGGTQLFNNPGPRSKTARAR